MAQLNAFFDRINDMIEDRMFELTEAGNEKLPEDVGLSADSCSKLWIEDDQGLWIRKWDDRTMQYFGGFEHVDKTINRREYGEYVFYSAADRRVANCIEYANFSEE